MAKLEACCRICETTSDLTRHHLIGRSRARGLKNNVVTLCVECHRAIHTRATKATTMSLLRPRLTQWELATIQTWPSKANKKLRREQNLAIARLDSHHRLRDTGFYRDEWVRRFGQQTAA